MTERVVLAVLGVVAAAVIPMTVSRLGVSLFWSQALGIVIGTFPMYVAVTKPKHVTKIFFPWLMVMSIATLVAFIARRVWE